LVREAGQFVEEQASEVTETAASSSHSQITDSKPTLSIEEPSGTVFAGYKTRKVASCSPVILQVERYFEMCDEESDAELSSDCVRLWYVRRLHLPHLFSWPCGHCQHQQAAHTAPVERVFSHGGIIMKPHRASLGEKALSELVFVKCNRLYDPTA
jgi:hypothetical protein